MYRVAIIGARRGLHHASAYAGLEDRARIVAVAELDAERRAQAATALGVPGYADWQTMLREQRPDVVHAVTSPLLARAQWVTPAAAAGVRLLVIEKPLALTPAEGAALAAAIVSSGLRVVVNHQRRYMPFGDALHELLADPTTGLGPVHFVRGSTIGKVMDMAPHLLDLALMATGDSDLTRIWAAADGFETHPEYPGPRRLLASFGTASGARLLIEATPEAEPTLGTRDFAADYPDFMPGYGPHRCNIDIWAERGRAWWREYGSWGYEVSGRPPHQAPTAFIRDDPPAQRAFTAALYDWLDGGRPHRCRFELTYRPFNALMAAGCAAHQGRALSLEPIRPDRPPSASEPEWAAALDWLRTTEGTA